MTSETPEVVLAIDFSRDQLDVALRDDDRQWLWSPRSYANDWPGWQKLKAHVLVELEARAPAHLTVVGESTGPYWWHAFYQFSHDPDLLPYDPQLALLNPAHAADGTEADQVKRIRQRIAAQLADGAPDPDRVRQTLAALARDGTWPSWPAGGAAWWAWTSRRRSCNGPAPQA